MANFPIIFYEMAHGYPTDVSTMSTLSREKWYMIFMTFKFFRLFHINEVTSSLKRVKDMLSDIFFMHKYMFDNILSWTLAGTKFFISMHLFACGWIKIQHIKL